MLERKSTRPRCLTNAQTVKRRFTLHTFQMKHVASLDPVRHKDRLPIPAIRTFHAHPGPRKGALGALTQLAELCATFMTSFLGFMKLPPEGRPNMTMLAKRTHVSPAADLFSFAVLAYRHDTRNGATT